MADKTGVVAAGRSILGEGDVLTIANGLVNVAPRWETLATCLRLSPSDIANIKSKHSGDVNQALIEVISRWLATSPQDQLTSSDLVEVLRQPVLNEEWSASQIEQKFRHGHKPTHLSKSVSSPPVLDQNSPTKDLIQSEGIPAIDSPSLQATPCDSVDTPSSPNKLLFRLSDDLADSAYRCGCGECQPETFNTKTCTNPLETNCRLPYVNTKGLSDGEKELLECRLKEAFSCINCNYAKFTSSLRKSLNKRSITPMELADVLMDLRGYQPLTKSSKYRSLLEDRYDELRNAEDISRAFKILSEYSSFFNYELIAFIVEMLGTEEDQQNLISYKEKFAAYCKRHVFECPYYSETSNKLESFTLKVDQRMTVGESGIFTAESLLHYKSKVAEVFDVTRYSLKLCSVQEGCLEIRFQTPKHIMEVILSQLDGKELNLRALGIQKVRYGDKEFLSTVFPALQAQDVSQKYMSYSPIGRSHSFPSQSSVCKWYWLTGSCRYKDSCFYSHNIHPIKSPAVGSILVPEIGEVSNEAILKIKPLGRNQDGKSYVVVIEERKIVAEDMPTLEYAQKKILRYLQSISAQPGHSTTRLNYTYFHPDGVEQAHLYVFKKRKKGRQHEVHKILPKEPVKTWNIEDFDHLNKEHVTRTSVHSRLTRRKRVEYPVLFRRNYREDIQARLAEGLRWMHEKGLIPKLEGRFGKITWKESFRDEIMDARMLAEFASNVGSDGLMFSTELDSHSPATLKGTCLPQIGFKDETYMFVLKARKGDESYRIRTKVDDGKPKIVYVRQLIDGRIQAQVLFDILCLHRKYDIRLSLQSVDKASTENPSITRFLSSAIEIPEPGVVRYNPFATDEKWNVTYIRHQQWESYEFHKYYTVSISAIGSYHINTDKLKPLVIRREDFSRHHEVELHCTLWEDLDAHSSDQYVNPHASPTSGDSASKPWTPKKILEEFEKDGFLQMMDELNKAMEFASGTVYS